MNVWNLWKAHRAGLWRDDGPGVPLALTAAEVNALPPRVRRYVMELETRCDHSGDVRRLAQQQDQIRELSASNRIHRDRLVAAEGMLASCKAAMLESHKFCGTQGTDWSHMVRAIDRLLPPTTTKET